MCSSLTLSPSFQQAAANNPGSDLANLVDDVKDGQISDTTVSDAFNGAANSWDPDTALSGVVDDLNDNGDLDMSA